MSTNAGAGRYTVAAKLSATRMIKGQKVLLVDADLRHQSGPRPGALLNLAPINTGIYEHLLEGQELAPQRSEDGDLHYIASSGSSLTDDLGLLALGATDLSKFLKPFQRGRYTIVDLPPLKDLEVALEMAGQLNQALVVVRSGETRRDELKKTMVQLNKRGIDCVATVVLDVPEERLEAAKLFSFSQPGEAFKFWRKTSFA